MIDAAKGVAVQTPTKTPDAAPLKGAAKQFEAIFLRQMISSMRAAKLADDDLFGSSAGDQFRDMSDARLADEMSEKSAFGIADLMLKQFMARAQSTPVATPAPARGAE